MKQARELKKGTGIQTTKKQLLSLTLWTVEDTCLVIFYEDLAAEPFSRLVRMRK